MIVLVQLTLEKSTPADEEVESKTSANCDDALLADTGEGFAEDINGHIELPGSFNNITRAGTGEKIQDGVGHSTHLVSRNSPSLADTEDNCALRKTDREENSPLGQADR